MVKHTWTERQDSPVVKIKKKKKKTEQIKQGEGSNTWLVPCRDQYADD